MKYLPVLAFLLAWLTLPAQDTVRVMHYNLLNYGNNYGDCNSSNNNVDDKNAYLKTIVGHIQPDIMTVNEMDDSETYHDYLLEQVFNTGGTAQFSRASLPNLSFSPIMNQVYFNTEVFSLASTQTVLTNYRDIDLLTFSYAGGNTQEPVQLRCAVAHLKAGTDPEDVQERASATYKLMTFLDNNAIDGNVLLCGDLNLYSGSESAFQNLLLYPEEDLRFKDPIGQVGEWHANAFFAPVHTQSTHVEGGCPSGGGMDDRFDFILASAEIMEGTAGAAYLPGSYQAVGQDGLRFDQSLVNPANTSVPQEVLTALFQMSDHLPVVMDLVITDPAGQAERSASLELSFPNPANGDVRLRISTGRPVSLNIRILDALGRIRVSMHEMVRETRSLLLPTAALVPGTYILHLETPGGVPIVRKLMLH